MAAKLARAGAHAGAYTRLRTLLDENGASLPELLRVVARTACEMVECKYAAVSVTSVDGRLEHFVPVTSSADTDAVVERMPSHERMLSAAIDKPVTVRVPDHGAGSGMSGEHPPIRTLLGVPILLGGRSVGGLYLSAPERGDFTEADEKAAQAVASAAASLIERARVAAEHERRQRWLAESTDLTRELLSGEHADPLQLLVERVLGIAEADLVAVVQPRVDDPMLTVTVAAGERAERVRGRVIPSDGTFAERVIANGEPITVEHLADTGRHNELIELIGADSAVLVPLEGRRSGRGMLAVFRSRHRPMFAGPDVAMTTMFAGQMALALELAESRAQRERLALLDERDRIARDLHDHVIQRLFAIGLAVQSTSVAVDDLSAKRLLATVDDIDETIAQIRATIYRLSGPITSSETSVRSQADRLIDELEPVLGFPVELEVHGPVDFGVDEEVIEDFAAVVREGLSNVARHAEATQAGLSVTVTTDRMIVEVCDDGRGMGAIARRSGLANLRARAERRGGTLTVLPKDTRGTSLVWSIPIDGVTTASR